MKPLNILNILNKAEALLKGHFLLSSGLHSEKYLQCALVLQHPDISEKIAQAIAKNFNKEKIDVVVGPALGGVTLAYEVARAIGVRGIFTERQDGVMILRRGFFIEKGERVLVVEDVVTTGLSTKEVIGVVERAGGITVGVASIIDRSSQPVDFGVPFFSLAKVDVKAYHAKDCPLCKANVPVVKPGSRR
jgi:orotate phosphoribosyltransferase